MAVNKQIENGLAKSRNPRNPIFGSY